MTFAVRARRDIGTEARLEKARSPPLFLLLFRIRARILFIIAPSCGNLK
jgi:hypothetical protein